MPERYRTEYDGEFVITVNTIKNGQKHQEREWIANPIENQHISGRAAVIGNGASRYNTKLHGKLNLKHKIEEHKGWHLGRKRLQSYGSEGCWREMQCDFYVEYNPEKLDEILEQGYQTKASVYSNARNCITHPGEFYLVPYGQRGRSLSVATWLACFDGHREVFLLGAEGQADNGEYDQQLINEMDNIMKEYDTVSFICVSDNIKPNDQWRKNLNFESWNYAKFVSVCDI